MQFVKVGKHYIVRLLKGEKIIEGVARLCKKEKIQAGFLSGIGAVLSAEIGFYDLEERDYVLNKFSKPHEIVSLSGNVALFENKPFLHIHTVLSDRDLKCFGGHLKEAVVGGTCEIYLNTEDIMLERVYDDETGLKLLNCPLTD